MVNETGKGLSVLIISEIDQNWETFATWYSLYKNWPDAKVSIICYRNGATPFELFQWTKRLKIPCVHGILPAPSEPINSTMNRLLTIYELSKIQKITFPLLMIKPFVMAVDTIDDDLLQMFNNENTCFNEDVWFFKTNTIESILNDFALNDKPLLSSYSMYFEAKEKESIKSLVVHHKGCGRWIHTSKGCPFSSAGGLKSNDMTVNESRIIELWERMVSLYNAVV